VPFQDWRKRRGIVWKFIAELYSRQPRQTSFGEAGFERRGAGKLQQIV
jgi:hypothetical protein